MQLDYQNNNFFNNKQLSNIDILKDFLLSSGEVIDEGTFRKIVEEQNKEYEKQIGLQFNNQTKTLTRDEYKEIAAPITAIVTKVYQDGAVDVKRPLDRLQDYWTHIPNFTIFQYLSVGDEVVLGCYNGEQKSNCWVMFAKLSYEDFKKKTIYKDIENFKIVHNNLKFLEKWLKVLGMDGEIKDVY